MKKIALLTSLLVSSIVYPQLPGTIDNTFDSSTGIDETVYDVKIDANNKLIVVGRFENYNTIAIGGVVRLNSDGTIDNTFNTGVGANSSIQSIAIQNDGKILLGGAFDVFNTESVNYLVRLNPDGSIDNSFNTGTGANSGVYSVKILSDGKILVGGIFTEFNGVACSGLIKLNSDGSVDNTFSFNEAGSTWNTTRHIEIINSNQIVVNRADKLLKLDMNGVVDNTFNSVSGLDIESLFVQSDNKILVGGYFTEYDGVSLNRIARLDSNGNVDTTFNIGDGFDYGVLGLSQQSNGKIIVTGNFDKYNNITQVNLARLNIDGTLDESFNPSGSGPNSAILGCELQGDGQIFIYGKFQNFNGVSRKRVAKLHGDSQLNVDEQLLPLNQMLSLHPNPTTGKLHITGKQEIKAIRLYDILGKLVLESSTTTLDISDFKSGIYVLKVTTFSGKQMTTKIVKE